MKEHRPVSGSGRGSGSYSGSYSEEEVEAISVCVCVRVCVHNNYYSLDNDVLHRIANSTQNMRFIQNLKKSKNKC